MLASLAGKPSRPEDYVEFISDNSGFPAFLKMILTLKEVGNALANSRDAVACTVGADRAYFAQQPLGSLDDIVLIAEGFLQGLLVLQEQRVLDQTEDLAEESNGLLVQLLRVANVGRDDLGERQTLFATAKLGPELLRLDSKLTTDSILGLDNMGIDVALIQTSGRGGRHIATERTALLERSCRQPRTR